MGEIQMTEFDLSSLEERSVPTGEIKYIPLALASLGIGIFFPGVNACLPTVVWSPDASDTLAMHVASPLDTPDKLEAAIANYKRQCPFPDDPFHISAAKVIGPEENRIAHIKGRNENLGFLESLTTIEEIHTDSEIGIILSFHPAHGFQIVRM